MTPPRRILIRSPNWVGDAVMSTPALRALRAAHPQATIALAAPPAFEPLFEGLASFDRFLPVERGLVAVVRHTRQLRNTPFDWAVLLPDSPRSALPAYLARTPRRMGYARDPLRRAMLTGWIDPPTDNGRRLPIPMVERYLRITRALDCDDCGDTLELAVDVAAAERVAGRLAAGGVGAADGYFVVAPGARFGASKLWPAAHFARACDGITRRRGLTAVLAPAPDEVVVAKQVAAAMSERCVTLAGPALDLRDLKALIARAQLVLSNDTGPRQIAVALCCPVVVLMGPTDPRHTEQHLERQRVLCETVDCRPCQLAACPIDHRCMTQLAPERAISAALDLLD